MEEEPQQIEIKNFMRKMINRAEIHEFANKITHNNLKEREIHSLSLLELLKNQIQNHYSQHI